MQLVIDIDEEDYKRMVSISKTQHWRSKLTVEQAIRCGTPLPKNATNGDVIKTLFPDVKITEIFGIYDPNNLWGYRTWFGGQPQDFFLDWWNAPYKAESEDQE